MEEVRMQRVARGQNEAAGVARKDPVGAYSYQCQNQRGHSPESRILTQSR